MVILEQQEFIELSKGIPFESVFSIERKLFLHFLKKGLCSEHSS